MTDTLAYADLFAIEAEFCKLSPYCIACALDLVMPATSHYEWTSEAVKFFRDLLKKKSFEAQMYNTHPSSLVACDINEPIQIIVLDQQPQAAVTATDATTASSNVHNGSGAGGGGGGHEHNQLETVFINEELVKKGFASYTFNKRVKQNMRLNTASPTAAAANNAAAAPATAAATATTNATAAAVAFEQSMCLDHIESVSAHNGRTMEQRHQQQQRQQRSGVGGDSDSLALYLPVSTLQEEEEVRKMLVDKYVTQQAEYISKRKSNHMQISTNLIHTKFNSECDFHLLSLLIFEI